MKSYVFSSVISTAAERCAGNRRGPGARDGAVLVQGFAVSYKFFITALTLNSS